jgi:hypothetical protein
LIGPIAHSPVAAGAGFWQSRSVFFAARSLYRGAAKDPLPEKLGAFARAMRNRFYLDEFLRGDLHPCARGVIQIGRVV